MTSLVRLAIFGVKGLGRKSKKRKKNKRKRQQQPAPAPDPAGPRLPTEFDNKLNDIGLELARKSLLERNWRTAYEFAEVAIDADPGLARSLMAEATSREARRCALRGQFVEADSWASKALALEPGSSSRQERRRLIKRACESIRIEMDHPLFADTVSSTSGRWWEDDLLAAVRGRDGGTATVTAPTILEETKRSKLVDVYAVGPYKPWHEGGRDPLFTQYLKSLKPGGRTIPYAAILLRQGLCEETDWIERVDAIVPVPTSVQSYEQRGFELTEEIAQELGARLCLPVIDALEIHPDRPPTHSLGGYRERARALSESLSVKKAKSKLLQQAEAVLIVDDIVTYGSTFEACSIKLADHYPEMQFYAAALAYTETQKRRDRAAAEADTDG